jgi:hypothetical protein
MVLRSLFAKYPRKVLNSIKKELMINKELTFLKCIIMKEAIENKLTTNKIPKNTLKI